MVENTEIGTKELTTDTPKTLLEQFNEIINSAAPDWDKLINLLKDNPDFAVSEELRNQLFPPADNISGIGVDTPPLDVMERNNEFLQKYQEADPTGFDKFIKEPMADGSNIATRLESYVNITEMKLSRINAAENPELANSLNTMLSAYNSAATLANSALPPLNVNDMDDVLRIGEQENKPALKLQEKQDPKAPAQELPTQTAVAGEVADEKQDNKPKKRDNKFDGIKNKDIIDYMYEDVILYYLSKAIKGTWGFIDKLIDEAETKAHINSTKMKEKAQKTQNNGLQLATQRCSAVMGDTTHSNNFLATRANRKNYAQEITRDIQNHIGEPPAKWEFVTNKKMINDLNQAYMAAPQSFNERLQQMQEDKSQDDLLDIQDRVYRVASLQARCQMVDKYLSASSYEKIVNDVPDLATLTESNYRDLYTCMQLAGAVATDDCAKEGITDPQAIAERRGQYMQNFLKYVTETTDKWQSSLTRDVTTGLFKANDEMKKFDRQESLQYSKDYQELLSDMLDAAPGYKLVNDDGKGISLDALARQNAVATDRENASDANMAAEALKLQDITSHHVQRRQNFTTAVRNTFGRKSSSAWKNILRQDQGR